MFDPLSPTDEAFAAPPPLSQPPSTAERVKFVAPHKTVFTAHQGVQGLHVPNSYSAIEQSIGWADAVEFDTFLAHRRDGSAEVVVIHPEGYTYFVNSEAMPFGKPLPQVLPESLEELQSIEVRGQRLVATLDEVLDMYESKKAAGVMPTELQIELKGPGTAIPVAENIINRIDRGGLSYDNVVLCSFMYPEEERNRFEIIRELSADLRLGLTIRGGDFAADTFDNIEEVYELVSRHNIEYLDISRRNLTPEIVTQTQARGIHQTCHHARTTDEIHAALSLGVDSIRADFFRGPDPRHYPAAQQTPAALFHALQETGFYRLRDWIWEQNWQLQSQVNAAITEGTSPTIPVYEYDGDPIGDDPVLLLDSEGARVVIPGGYGKHPETLVLELGKLKIPNDLLSNSDRQNGELSYNDLLPPGTSAIGFWDCVKAVEQSSELFHDIVAALDGAEELHSELFSWPYLELLASGGGAAVVEALQERKVELSAEDFTALESLAQEYLTRSGRVLGMLLFTATGPLQRDTDTLYLEGAIDSYLLNVPTVKRALTEQFEAHALRSGNIGTIENAYDIPEIITDLRPRIPELITFPDGLVLPSRKQMATPGDIDSLETHSELPEIVYQHWKEVPYQPPHDVENAVAWFEGSFNPLGPNHVRMIWSLVEMGFPKIVLGTVPLNPHKPSSDILPFKHRYDMDNLILQHEGLPIAETPEDDGIYITRSTSDFQEHRLRAWFQSDHYILMGPDNFHTYYNEDRAWALFSVDNAAFTSSTKFRHLYEELLKPRILLYPSHYIHHASDTRNGDAPPHPAVDRYWRDNQLTDLLEQRKSASG